jgi:copper homeostasis protein (lipoprotein)
MRDPRDRWPDQAFHRRREWLGKDRVRAVIGRGRADPARLDVTFEGWLTDCPRLEGAGVERRIVVKRCINARPDAQGELAQAEASLTTPSWRLSSLEGHSVRPATALRAPHRGLRREDPHQTAAATIGGKQLAGS